MAKRQENKNSDIVIESGVTDKPESGQPISEEMTDIPDIEFNAEPEQSKPTTKVCTIIGLASGAVHVDFDGYGVAVCVKDVEIYQNRKMIRVSCSGEINKPDFKVWVD